MKRLVAGMGLSGLETAEFLKRNKLSFDTYDDNKSLEEVRTLLGDWGGKHFMDLARMNLHRYEEMVISPGMSMRHPLTRAALHHNLQIVSEIELAWRECKGKIIGVTGSNGKSTTVSLIHHILLENGVKSVLCGNIGVPFIGVVDDDPERVYVVEISSFQLEHVHAFRPDVGILLNLAPDHLDRHGTMEVYGGVKKRMFANQEPGDLAVVGADVPGGPPGDGRLLPVPGTRVRMTDQHILVGDDFILDIRKLPLMGSHNLGNLMFACVAAVRMGISAAGVAMALASFKGLEHRMEPVGELEGRLWVNDTKATNVHAAQAAIDAMTDRPYVQILGGCDKGERFNSLDFTKHPPKALVVYGETAPILLEDLATLKPVHHHDFHDAVAAAHQMAGPDGLVLLAPACASFDQFQNFALRGVVFKKIFAEMGGAA